MTLKKHFPPIFYDWRMCGSQPKLLFEMTRIRSFRILCLKTNKKNWLLYFPKFRTKRCKHDKKKIYKVHYSAETLLRHEGFFFIKNYSNITVSGQSAILRAANITVRAIPWVSFNLFCANFNSVFKVQCHAILDWTVLINQFHIPSYCNSDDQTYIKLKISFCVVKAIAK